MSAVEEKILAAREADRVAEVNRFISNTYNAYIEEKSLHGVAVFKGEVVDIYYIIVVDAYLALSRILATLDEEKERDPSVELSAAMSIFLGEKQLLQQIIPLLDDKCLFIQQAKTLANHPKLSTNMRDSIISILVSTKIL